MIPPSLGYPLTNTVYPGEGRGIGRQSYVNALQRNKKGRVALRPRDPAVSSHAILATLARVLRLHTPTAAHCVASAARKIQYYSATPRVLLHMPLQAVIS